MTNRIKRINSLIKQIIANILIKELSFDDVLITVQGVKTSRDLKHAKIRISIMPFSKSQKVLKTLERNIISIQKQLNKILEIKFIPRIKFEIDKGEEKADRIERILKEL